MPRSIWSGTISFGLVSIPVRMVGAVSEHALHFNLLHRKDSSPIGYEKVCKQEGKRVPDDEIVKAYEIKKGEFVEVDDEDFEAARAEGYHTFDISDFVEVDEIDPIYFEQSYYLVPQDGGEKVYTLLVRAMENAGLAAVGTFVMREREHLGSCGSGTVSSCLSGCISPTRSAPPTSSSPAGRACPGRSWRWRQP